LVGVPPGAADARRRIGVLGLWHLGSVTAACLAESGADVLGVDPDRALVAALARGRGPVSEPGLDELIVREMQSGHLRFSAEASGLKAVDQAWITFDTPVDEEDQADVNWVLDTVIELLEPLVEGTLVVVSSQLPVGSVAALEARAAVSRPGRVLRFACVPENLRLGGALEVFRRPDRVVVGVRSDADRPELAATLAPFTSNIEWMRVESAEMTKHALNGFLATSVAFINEVAAICEHVGADAAEVSRGLKSERRVGPRAYLAPGDAFAGGTLARDVAFLRGLADRHQLPSYVFTGVAEGNLAHKQWTRRRLTGLLGRGGGDDRQLAGRTVAVWGLTYKPGTDTLRRSSAVELCEWLVGAGATVRAHDPAVTALPAELGQQFELCADPLDAAISADALVICTAWPEYREIRADGLARTMRRPLVLDPAGFLSASLGESPDLAYVRVGTPAFEDVVVTAP
jgi:UDPglucose 6-dehydrogenase